MKMKYIALVFGNAVIAAGIGYAAFEMIKRTSDEQAAIQEEAQELAEQLTADSLEEAAAQRHLEAQVKCLATNVYYETMASSLVDSMSVTDVVLNRVAHEKYPNTPCDVVHQSYLNDKGEPLRNKCQFSWYCDGKADEPQDQISWEQSIEHAAIMYTTGKWRGITEGATHYHATYVSPKWAQDYTKIAQIGAHIFYRQEDGQY
tara:strand:- start:708 stop:1316 length:609 start_codon:yes stop_codon:yes gene_type:complete